jgi:hypothetical protein
MDYGNKSGQSKTIINQLIDTEFCDIKKILIGQFEVSVVYYFIFLS